MKFTQKDLATRANWNEYDVDVKDVLVNSLNEPLQWFPVTGLNDNEVKFHISEEPISRDNVHYFIQATHRRVPAHPRPDYTPVSELEKFPATNMDLVTFLFYCNFMTMLEGNEPPYIVLKRNGNQDWCWMNPKFTKGYIIPNHDDFKIMTEYWPKWVESVGDDWADYMVVQKNSEGQLHPNRKRKPFRFPNIGGGLADIYDLLGNSFKGMWQNSPPVLTPQIISENADLQTENFDEALDYFKYLMEHKLPPTGYHNWCGVFYS